MKLDQTKAKEKFLTNCIEKRCIPKGLQLSFNLAYALDNGGLLDTIQTHLNQAASRILDSLLIATKLRNQTLSKEISSERECVCLQLGQRRTNQLIHEIRTTNSAFISKLQSTLDRKLSALGCGKSGAPSPSQGGGSVRIKACEYKNPSPQASTSASTFTRPHRRNRHKNRQKRCAPSEDSRSRADDHKAFDPIVLARNVTLTEEQKSICRLPDCFAPTPRSPIDVCDQTLGTVAWAERLRWHRYHYLKKLKLSPEERKEADEAFEKTPWYQPTTRAAPKNDPALEAFINACSNNFLDSTKRKRITDNLTPGQRQAMKELRALPVTHGAACRYADKSGVTVITSLEDDDRQILETLNDPDHYELVPENPNNRVREKVNRWTKEWSSRGVLTQDIAAYANNIANSQPGKSKPLIKTHKSQPYPMRLLLSGCGTPIEPLSKIVQTAICHLTDSLPYQIIDTKEFLVKVKRINEELAPLPDTATIAVCDVVSLYPNVNNDMGVPATAKLLSRHPSTLQLPTECVLQALDITLNNNYTQFTGGDQKTIYAKPIKGTAMGPSHACDYVDIFMSELDSELVSSAPVALLSSLGPPEKFHSLTTLDWSRFRDDGIAILPDAAEVDAFTQHLQMLHPPSIKWVVNHGKTAEYLDLRLQIKDGFIESDVFSKNNHSYLPPTSCHPPSVFKGLISGVGTRLRMLCSQDDVLEKRIGEYTDYFAMSGWKPNHARKELERGANRDRNQILTKPRTKKSKKLAWVTTYDPRVPPKSKIIKDNLHILYTNPENNNIFPRGMIISAD